jgi:hypothetical protein
MLGSAERLLHPLTPRSEVSYVGEAKTGEEFITHEFDEAIAIQQSILSAEQALSKDHPRAEAKVIIAAALKEDQRFLKELQRLGKKHGATGVVEGVAEGLKKLQQETTESASEAESEAYEAHAVLVNLKRKQQDSGAAMLKIARATDDTELAIAATEFTRVTKASAQELADDLAEFAVAIATADGASASR